MGLTKNIKKLVHYGIGAKLIQPEDEIFMINQYLDLFGLDEYGEMKKRKQHHLRVFAP